jgi:hypothetical protein
MRRRDVLSLGMGFLGWLVLPRVVAAEESKAERDPRWNGTYDNLGREPHDAEKCGCRTRFGDESQQSGGLYWVGNSGVDWHSQRVNRLRSRHSGVLWQARAFPGSVGRIHGFHGRRGHGRRW